MQNMKIQLQMFCNTILEKEWWFQENICVKRNVKRNILCHAPVPGPTRLADPNRFPGARLRTETLYLIFFFLKAN